MAKTIGVHDDDHRAILTYAAAHQVSMAEAASRLIAAGAETAPRKVTLNDAAEAFMGQMAPAQVDLIRELSRETGISPAAYLLSYAKLAFEQGQSALVTADDDLERALDRPVVPAAEAQSACERCQAPFKPKRAGQRFCSDECGYTAAHEAIKQSRENYLRRTRPDRDVIARAAAPKGDVLTA